MRNRSVNKCKSINFWILCAQCMKLFFDDSTVCDSSIYMYSNCRSLQRYICKQSVLITDGQFKVPQRFVWLLYGLTYSLSGAFIIYGRGGGGWFGKIDRQKKKRPPSQIRGKKIAPSPPMTLLENFCPHQPHVLKTCLYVFAVVLPQQF